jgi:hypothetical protein
MTVDEIVEIIKKRRDALKGSASIGNAPDPLIASGAQVAWEKAEEYDALLAEIEK